MTNIEGLGAVRLMESLLPELLALEPGISHVLTPDSATFAEMVSRAGIPCTRVRRRLPKALSRTLEVLFPGHHLAGPGPVLVFGDLPIRGVRNQVVFVHNFHLATSLQPRLSVDYIRQRAMQFLFSRNVSDAAIVVVQTDLMRQALCQRFGIDAEKVRVIPQPVPKWVAGDVEEEDLPVTPADAGLRLFYPSRAYPHKNHALLGAGRPGDMDDLIGSLELTVPADANPNPGLSWIHCVGELPTDAVIDRYHTCDAVVFFRKQRVMGCPWSRRWLWASRSSAPIFPMRAPCAETGHSTSTRTISRALRTRSRVFRNPLLAARGPTGPMPCRGSPGVGRIPREPFWMSAARSSVWPDRLSVIQLFSAMSAATRDMAASSISSASAFDRASV